MHILNNSSVLFCHKKSKALKKNCVDILTNHGDQMLESTTALDMKCHSCSSAGRCIDSVIAMMISLNIW